MSEILNLKSHLKSLKIVVDGEHAATATYNPNDPLMYKKLLTIIDLFKRGGGFSIDEKEYSELAEELKAAEDIETASDALSRVSKVLHGGLDVFASLADSINDIFGEGVAECLFRHGKDSEYIGLLLETALKDAKKSRKAVTDVYRINAGNDVLQ